MINKGTDESRILMGTSDPFVWILFQSRLIHRIVRTFSLLSSMEEQGIMDNGDTIDIHSAAQLIGRLY